MQGRKNKCQAERINAMRDAQIKHFRNEEGAVTLTEKYYLFYLCKAISQLLTLLGSQQQPRRADIFLLA